MERSSPDQQGRGCPPSTPQPAMYCTMPSSRPGGRRTPWANAQRICGSIWCGESPHSWFDSRR